VGDGQADTQVY